MYSVELTKKVKQFLKKISKNEAEIILKKLYSIRENPFPYLKKLKGNKLWRLRISKYRAIIDIIVSGQQIVILKIDYRKRV